MDLKNHRAVQTAATHAVLDNPGNPKAVAGVYVAITMGLSLLSTILMALLDKRISNTGGLANMGLRSILSTIQTILPMLLAFGLMVLQLGYRKAAMDITHHRAVTPRTLTRGAHRFGPMLRAVMLQYGLYTLLMLLAMYVASFIFMSTPLSNRFYTLVTPLLSDPESLYAAMYGDSQMFSQIATTLLPALPIFAVLALAVCAPFFYGYRMVGYCILSGLGARASMRASSRMMKGHRLELLKLDLSFWWFYLAHGLTTVILYGDVLLGMAGVTLPFSTTVVTYLFYGLSLLAEGVLYYFCMNRVETAYAMVYNLLRPKNPPTQGVVLGNIFDLAKDHPNA